MVTTLAIPEDKEESHSATITVIIVATLVGEAPDEVPVIAAEVVMPVVEEETLSVSGAINLVTTQMPVQITNRILQ